MYAIKSADVAGPSPLLIKADCAKSSVSHAAADATSVSAASPSINVRVPSPK